MWLPRLSMQLAPPVFCQLLCSFHFALTCATSPCEVAVRLGSTPPCNCISMHQAVAIVHSPSDLSTGVEEIQLPEHPGNLGLAICHAYLKTFLPELRGNGTGPCAKLTFADAIQVIKLTW